MIIIKPLAALIVIFAIAVAVIEVRRTQTDKVTSNLSWVYQ